MIRDQILQWMIDRLERLTFASIYQSNLDEFYMVRVGTLMDQMEAPEEIRENKTNMTSKEQVKVILDATRVLDKKHVFMSKVPLDMSFVFAIQNYLRGQEKENLFYHKRNSRMTDQLNDKERLIEQVEKKDVLLYLPFCFGHNLSRLYR